jgi:hypothetical protein
MTAEGDHDGAIALLEELIDDLTRGGQVRATITAAVQLSAAQERALRRIAAERTLAGVLARAVPAGLRQTIIDGGPDIAAVLGRLLEHAHADAWPGTHPPIPAAQLASLLARTTTGPPKCS